MISQPSLWSFISGSYPDLIPSLLDRSKCAELDVHVTSRRVPEVIRYINSHVHRLSSLHFEFDYGGGDGVDAALRGLGAAPKLRRLTIDCPELFFPDPPEYTPGINNPIPSLHYLQLNGFPVTPQLIQLRNLTVVGLDARRATPRTVLDLLSRNPLLRVVHLWGGYSPEALDGDNGHPPGSITLDHLEVILLEMTPLIHFEALSPPHGTRIFSGFARGVGSHGAGGGSYAASFPIPGSFSNLQGLRKLCLVDQKEIYVKLEGERGSITYCMSPERPFGAGTFGGVPLEEVTDATYELSTLFRYDSFARPTTSQPMVSRIVSAMVRLQKLELSCGVEEVEYFLLVLYSPRVCRDLRILVLSHCTELYRRMGGLAVLAEIRKAEGIGLDTVRIVHPNIRQLKGTFKQGDVTRLERAVGALEYVEAERGRSGRSSLRFDPVVGINQPFIF